LFIGLLDFIYQKFKFNRDQKMSKQEVKDENKMQEGDQAIKQKMKQMGFEMVRKSMMTEVPKATVVVTNPTFIALAIQYEREAGQTPKIVAKGKRLIAENIKKVAEENSVPIVENKPLARGMYDLVEVGDEIPETFFNAVAEVLAYVYKMDNRNS
jgi:flagellar biosynthetic protein FlhB